MLLGLWIDSLPSLICEFGLVERRMIELLPWAGAPHSVCRLRRGQAYRMLGWTPDLAAAEHRSASRPLKETPGRAPVEVEAELLASFRQASGKPPLANDPHGLGA
jgi:hypothetical protein